MTDCSTPILGLRPPAPFAAVGVGPLIIAHRGGSLEAPENTLAAFRHGVAAGSDWQELDVTLSSDGQLVVIHDDDLDRTTNGSGPVGKKTWADLQKLTAGQPNWSKEAAIRLTKMGVTLPDFGNTYVKERIPSLEQVLALPGTRLMIEMKNTPMRHAQLARLTVDAVHRAGALGRVALGSFEPDLLAAVYQLDPSLPLIGIVENASRFEKMMELPISVFAVDLPLVQMARQMAPPGVAVWAFTVQDVETARLLAEAGAHGLITDIPHAVHQSLRGDEGLAQR